MKGLRDRIEFYLARLIAGVLALLPLPLSGWIGQALGVFVFDVVRLRRRVTVDNLRQSFPEKSEREIAALARRVYRNMGLTLAEFARLPRLGAEGLRARVEFVHPEVLEKAWSRGKGAILVGGHFANWEWAAASIHVLGYKVRPIVAYQRNPLVDRLIDRVRNSVGMQVVKVGPTSVRETLRTLENNGFVAILFDQDAGKNGEFVRFFGRPVSAPRGPAVFHLKTGAPIVLVDSLRTSPGKLRVRLEYLDFTAEPGDEDEKIHRVMQVLTERLEQSIRRHPEQWFWMHRRWKSSHLAPSPAVERAA